METLNNGESGLSIRNKINSNFSQSTALQHHGKTIVCFGDSITEDGNYPATVGESIGATAHNVGFGGCRMAQHSSSVGADYDAFSMYNLADGVVSGVWTRQVTAANDLAATDDNTAIVARLQAINFANVDIITIFYGTNDFTGDIPIGTNADATGATFKGAINHTIQTIQDTYPDIQIVFITPLYRNIGGLAGTSCDTYTNSNGAKLIDFVNAIEEVCALHHIECLSMIDTAGINSRTLATYTSDGTHPNTAGDNMIARRIAGYLNSH